MDNSAEESSEVQRLMTSIIRRMARMFYEDHHAVIMDIMLESHILEEEDLADKMKMLPRELNRLAFRLRDDRLLSAETVNDLKEDGRQVTTTKFFLDFRNIRDVVKYKIYIMTQTLEKKVREVEGALGFGCPDCRQSYSLLEAQSYLCRADFAFKCPQCGAELEEKKSPANDLGESPASLFSRLMEEVGPIIKDLKEIDHFGIPEMSRGKILFPSKAPALEDREAPRMEEPKAPAPQAKEPPLRREELIGLDEYTSKASEAPALHEISELVSVDGVPKKFSEVTESDKERMSDEEYERYFEIYEGRAAGRF